MLGGSVQDMAAGTWVVSSNTIWEGRAYILGVGFQEGGEPGVKL